LEGEVLLWIILHKNTKLDKELIKKKVVVLLKTKYKRKYIRATTKNNTGQLEMQGMRWL